ncbi:hypothetical protein GCM10011367_16520 [Marinicauda pacifica]|uniref:histidine kinase n=1 Tax=Marinicauda pacifica TaxID=1133559 RepID=A0A4S2HAV2_9PROT|nr:PAS domain-containing protein [Marinicauda pacifica]TGY93060.1 PAS domain S-box protein [Marinicauda pacifica]GGE42463.1 hypothetical protein GCM10011367_16520 [Marinicauda pacifica]
MTEMSRSVIFEAFDAFPQACAVVDADLRILQTNPALCSLAGRSAKALTGLGFNTLLADRLDIDLVRSSLSTDSPLSGLSCLISRSDGAPAPVTLDVRLLPSSPDCRLLVVTPRASPASPTQETHGLSGTYRLDLAHRQARVSPALEHFLTGRARDGRISVEAWLKAIHATDRARIKDRLRAVSGHRLDVHAFECRMRRHDGAWRQMRHQFRVLTHGRRGQPLAFSGIVHDATRTAATGPETDPRLRLACQAADLCAWSYDFEADEGHSTGRLHTGQEGPFCYSDWRSRVHPDDRSRVSAAFLALQFGATMEERYRIRDETGSEQTHVCHAEPCDSAGQAYGFTRLAESASAEAVASTPEINTVDQAAARSMRVASITAWTRDMTSDRMTISGPLCERLDLDQVDGSFSFSKWKDCVHPDDWPRLVDLCRSNFETAPNGEINYRIRDKNQQYIHVRARGGVSEQTPDGQVLTLAGVLSETDEVEHLREQLAVTERARAEAAAAANITAWFHEIATGRLTLEGPLCPAIELAEAFSDGGTRLVLDAEDWRSAIHEDDLHGLLSGLGRLAPDHQEDFEVRIRTRDGDYRWINLRGGVSQVGPDGAPTRLSGFITDITERRVLEKDLALEKARLDSIYQQTPALLHTMDKHGNTLMVNRHWVARLGYREDEVIGRPGLIVVHPDDRERVARTLLPQTLEKGELVREPVRLVTSQGEVLETRISAFAEYDLSGTPRAAHAVFEDLTDIQAARKELEARAEELERTNRELNRFATVASHDLQEPLRKIAAFSGLLRRRYQDRLDEDGLSSLDFLVDAAGRMRTLIDDLLGYSRASSRPLKTSRIELESVVEALLKELGVLIEETGAIIEIDALPAVYGDTTLLRLLFQNLITNAIKYRGQDAPYIRIGSVRAGDSWRIHVMDNGIGIEGKFFNKIFDPFQRLHARGDYEGTGIGLAICQQAAERHGGRIWVDSAPGRGSSFYFTLPTGTAEDVPD